MHSVYALVDPRTQQVRYIGIAQDIHRRYAQHMLYPQGGEAKLAWMEELKQCGRGVREPARCHNAGRD